MNATASQARATVVLVHGAWADGSSWAHVIGSLQSTGLKVIAAPVPLTSIGDDEAALDRALERTEGPLVLVGHAYAGAVIAASANERIRSLVFITALTPDEGETVAEVFYRDKPRPAAPSLASDRHGFVWIPEERFGVAFCQNAPQDQTALLAATQRPIPIQCIQQKGSRAGVGEETNLVSCCSRKSDDQSGDTALFNPAYECANPFSKNRSYPVGYGAGGRCRSDSRGCNRVGETTRSVGRGRPVNQVYPKGSMQRDAVGPADRRSVYTCK